MKGSGMTPDEGKSSFKTATRIEKFSLPRIHGERSKRFEVLPSFLFIDKSGAYFL